MDLNFIDKWCKIKSIDMHTAGEPLRIIYEGLPKIEGKTILEKRRFFKKNYDHIRKSLMWEPRGHADMYGAILTEPEREDSDFGVLFIHNEGYSTMCGHGIIGLAKFAVQTKFVNVSEPITTIRIDTPAGLVTAFVRIENKSIKQIWFENVPSFIYLKDESITVENLGKIQFDIAFGGAFYAFVNADRYNIEMTPENYKELIEKGMAIKYAIMEKYNIKHPFKEDLNFLYGTIFYGNALSNDADSRNVCVFADGEVDRSPTGTGVSARMALHYFKKELPLNKEYIIESIIGTKFIGEAVKVVKFGDYEAVIPKVSGSAFIIGKNEWVYDPEDQIKEGFFLR